jgi:hypothetical protein
MRLFALFLIGSVSSVAQPALTDFIPPQSKVIIGINVRHMIDAAQLPDLETGTQAISTMMLTQSGLSGMNPLKDVDAVLIASTGEGDNPPSVAILSGRFAQVQLTDKKDVKGAVRRISDTLIVAGDPGLVNLMVEHSDALKPSPQLVERMVALSGKFDIWGTGDNPKGFSVAKDQTGGLNGDAIDHFEFGASFQKGLTAEAEFHVKSPQDMEKLTQSLKFLELLMSAQKTSTSGSKFSLGAKDGTVKLALFIPEEELKKAIAAQKNSFSLMPKITRIQPKPVDTKGKIVTNSTGDTVSVTLPGGH